jgi:hypothetical protein
LLVAPAFGQEAGPARLTRQQARESNILAAELLRAKLPLQLDGVGRFVDVRLENDDLRVVYVIDTTLGAAAARADARRQIELKCGLPRTGPALEAGVSFVYQYVRRGRALFNASLAACP